ncbi:DUF5984 family protein [Bacteroides sp. 519]|uniref:DUF5984 family protein n=1 Tax=Bacteroides sp. 519 TaxID=2302937 RepID=UPI0013D0EAE7|nr:DUF5984 family protein [Bacteroides sp. 519]NDV60547.1 hypothetical protein [Bacteroides sp. 519]
MIKFELKDIDEVMLFGGTPKYTAHWFALTDGLYWLNFGNTKIYEYSDEFLKDIDSKTKFVDYYIVRLLEDFSDLFPAIAEQVSVELYKQVDTPEKLSSFLTQHCETKQWIYNRTLYASHLQNAPIISFIRVEDKLHVIWLIDNKKDSMWTAENGYTTIQYTEFVENVEQFGKDFFLAMDKQIQKAIDKDWGENVDIDKPRLLIEQQERRIDFQQKLDALKHAIK